MADTDKTYWDTIVIGSGIGGMAAGAALSRVGGQDAYEPLPCGPRRGKSGYSRGTLGRVARRRQRQSESFPAVPGVEGERTQHIIIPPPRLLTFEQPILMPACPLN